ncbi:MAG TPA: hypothetical protein VIW67_03945 [Terriglobales bacterium]
MTRWIILLALTTATLFATEKPFVRVRWKGSTVRITYKEKLMVYNYGVPDGGSGLLLYAVDTVKTEYLAEKQNVVYMILDVRGPSRGPQAAMSYCGAGIEGAKILFTFDRQGEVKPPQVVMYESCYLTLEPMMDDLQLANGERALAKFEMYPAAPAGHSITKDVVKRFDPEHPEAGVTSSETCTDRDMNDKSGATKDIPCPK